MAITHITDSPQTLRSTLFSALVAAVLPAVLAAWTPRVEAAPDASGTANVAVARIPFQTTAGLIIIPVAINETEEIPCILDTGMPEGMFLLDPDLGERLDLEYIGSVAVGGGGSTPKTAQVAMGVSMRVEGIEFTNQRLFVLDEPEDMANLGVSGVIGASVFNRFIVEVDFESRVVTLYDPETFDDAAAGESIPLTITATKPAAQVHVAIDDAAPVPVMLMVDSGANAALSLDRTANERIPAPHRNIDGVLGHGVGGEITGLIGRASSLRIGSYEFENVVAGFPHDSQGLQQGTLGLGILRRFLVTFDYPGERLMLRPNGEFAERFEYNMAGVVLIPVGMDRLRVVEIHDDSPAKSAGITAGDLVLAINGSGIDALTADAVIELFQQAGATLVLTVEREGERTEVSVVLRRLI